MNGSFLLALAVAFMTLFPPSVWGQSVSIGSVDGVPGATLEIPVDVDVSEDLVGIHLRLKFNPEVFLSPQVEKGPLLNGNHLMEYASPKDGELNIVAYSKLGGAPFNGHNGTVLLIGMTLSDFAPAGSHAIGFATPVVETVTLPPTGLAGVSGTPIQHSRTAGEVRIEGLEDGDLDGNQDLNGLDLLLFSHWWRSQPNSSNSAANVIKTPPNDLIEARDLLRLIDLWKHSMKSSR